MKKIKFLTPEIIEELPNIANDFCFEDEKNTNLKYKGFCIFEIFFEKNEVKYYCGSCKNLFSDEDIEKVKNWMPKTKGKYYQDYYRMDFDKYIFIFQHYIYKDERILLGNLLIKDMETRLDLASIHQSYILEELINGRKNIR